VIGHYRTRARQRGRKGKRANPREPLTWPRTQGDGLRPLLAWRVGRHQPIRGRKTQNDRQLLKRWPSSFLAPDSRRDSRGRCDVALRAISVRLQQVSCRSDVQGCVERLSISFWSDLLVLALAVP